MKLFFCFITFLITVSIGNSQVFNKVYPSIRPELLTVDGLTFTIPLPNNEAYFLTYSIPLLGPYYSYMIVTKVDRNGDVLWFKYISDSLGYFLPRHFEFISNNRIMMAGFKYPPERGLQSIGMGFLIWN